jgi:hypothetical protein
MAIGRLPLHSHRPVAVAQGLAMSMVYFTIVAIILYVTADWLLERVEVAAGRRLKNRSLIFFVILMTLALSSFSLIQHYTGGA